MLALAKFPQVLESTLVAAGLVQSRGWQSENGDHDNDDGGGCGDDGNNTSLPRVEGQEKQ